MTLEDAVAIRQIAGLSAVAPVASKQMLAVLGNRNWRTSVTGITNDYLVARGHVVEKGRELTPGEVASGRAVCLVGVTVVRELFGSGDPLGAAVRLGRVSCTIVGVLASKGASMGGNDNDDTVLLPIKAFHRRIAGNTDVAMIFVSVGEGRSTSSIKSQIESLMRERRRIAAGGADDFNVRDMQEIIETVSSTTNMMTALLGAVAAVSLLVGGIGIMNIMLVSVTERTREIGIRLAVGALGRDVLLQFLIEAITLSLLGGTFGVLLGLGGAFAITRALKMPFLVSPNMVVLAFAFSAFVGVLFGYLPARKAAHLDPIEALRHE